MQSLPPELQRRIFKTLSLRDLYHLGLTSKNLYHATDDAALWIRAIEREFFVSSDRYLSETSPRRFYVKLLVPYGDTLGFWLVYFYESCTLR